MIFFLGLIVGVLSFSEYECPFFATYYNDGEVGYCSRTCTNGCYEIYYGISNYVCVNTACMYGYYDTGNGCSACSDENAMSCIDEGDTATSCWDGYYLDGNSCVSCDDYGECNVCDETECLECSQYAAMDGAGHCIKCDDTSFSGGDDGANACNFDVDHLVATSCREGYAFNDENECIDCGGEAGYTGGSSGATSCTVSGTEVTVTQCDVQYGKCLGDDGQCYPATNWMEDCSYNTGTGLYTATSCWSYHDLCTDVSGNTGCYTCSEGQGTCTFTDNTCTTVDTTPGSYTCQYEGYAYVDDGAGTCVACSDPAYYCSACTFDGSARCTSCLNTDPDERGYYVDTEDDTCKQCGNGCAECVDDTECTTCMSVLGNEACYDDSDDDSDDDGDDDSDDDSDDDNDDDSDDDSDDSNDDNNDDDIQQDHSSHQSWNIFFL